MNESGIFTVSFGTFAAVVVGIWVLLRLYVACVERGSFDKRPEHRLEPKPKKPGIVIDLKEYRLEAVLSAVLGIYAAFIFWDVWSIGVKGLGFNATVFIYGLTALLAVTRTKERSLASRDWPWLVTSVAIGLSFSLYENDFLEPITCFVFPALLLLNFVVTGDQFRDRFLGAPQVFRKILSQIAFKLFGTLRPAWDGYLRFITTSSNLTRARAVKITQGIIWLIGIFVIVLPLLYSSDRIFAFLVERLSGWFGELIIENRSVFIKIPYAVLVTLVLLGICIRQKPQTLPAVDQTPKALDSIVSGIVLSGLLTLYISYLFAQIDQLWAGNFSFSPDDISSLGATGVWQLLSISVINVIGFHFLSRRLNRVVRMLLPALAIVSVLLLGPAIYKTYIFILWKGLGYETFYTTALLLFFVILLGGLCLEALKTTYSDVVKRALLTFSLMYSLVAVFPVSQLAYAVNSLVGSEEHDRSMHRERLRDVEELLSPALTAIAQESENLKDFQSLLEMIQFVDVALAKDSDLCVSLIDRLNVDGLSLSPCDLSTKTDEQHLFLAINAENFRTWAEASDSIFAKNFWNRFSTTAGLTRRARISDSALLSEMTERKRNGNYLNYREMTNQNVGISAEYCLTPSDLIQFISPKGCRLLRGVALWSPRSDPDVFEVRSVIPFVDIVKEDLLFTLEIFPTTVKAEPDWRPVPLRWDQMSFEAFSIEDSRKQLKRRQKEIHLSALDELNLLKSQQRKTRKKWLAEIEEVSAMSSFAEVIEKWILPHGAL